MARQFGFILGVFLQMDSFSRKKKEKKQLQDFSLFPHVVRLCSIRTPQIMTICSYFSSEPDLLFI